jgi:U3 small nucleolar RNA-associated protein 11
MMSSRTVNGIKIGDRGNKALSHDVVMLLKTQDAGYLRTALQKTRLEKQKLESSIILEKASEESVVSLLGREEQRPSKKVFVDSVEEQNDYDKSQAKSSIGAEDEESSEKDRLENLANEYDLDDEFTDAHNQESTSKLSNSRRAQSRMLQALKKREQALIVATRELESQRAKMSNTVGGVNKNGVKFKVRERKR